MKTLIIAAIFSASGFAFSQVAIGHDIPDIHAQLDVKAERKGILIPRIALKNNKSSYPFDTTSTSIPESLLVYNEKKDNPSTSQGYYYWRDNQWHKLITEEDILSYESMYGAFAISSVSNTLTTTSEKGYSLKTTINGVSSDVVNIPQPWNIAGSSAKAVRNTEDIYHQGNIGIGKINMIPEAKLHVDGSVRFDNIITAKDPPYILTMDKNNQVLKIANDLAVSSVSNTLATINEKGYPLTTTVDGVSSAVVNIPQPWNIAGSGVKASSNIEKIYHQGDIGIGKANMDPKATLHVDGSVRFDNITITKTPLYIVTINTDNQVQKTAANDFVIPKGVIVMWSGYQYEIPNGWAVCNGAKGTPDLRNRFVVGAGGKYSFRNTGGEERVKLTIDEMPKHSHSFKMHNGYNQGRYGNANAPWNNVEHHDLKMETKYTSEEGSGASHQNLPPYYALYYIMKL